MIRPRIIPILLIKDGSLVKTINFTNPTYLGDPINALKIFNEKEVDELCILDISASRNGINFNLLKDLADEAFMPLSYGGGINNIVDAKKIINIGFEKIIINQNTYKSFSLVKDLSSEIGSQSVVVSIDYKKNSFGLRSCYYNNGRIKSNIDPIEHSKNAAKNGAGELLITSINHEGKMEGFDYDFIAKISKAVDIPVIAHGGAGLLSHISTVLYENGASAVAVGSLFVYFGKKKGILINYPDFKTLIEKGVYK